MQNLVCIVDVAQHVNDDVIQSKDMTRGTASVILIASKLPFLKM